MAKRYYKSVKSVKKVSWSHENRGCVIPFGTELVNELYQGGSIVVPSVTNQGTRTVGNWNITVPVSASAAAEFFWALVYVPQGTTASALFATTGTTSGSLYEPNQYVIASGISDSSAGPIRIRSRIQRKLHSGDFVSLLIGAASTGFPTSGATARALVSYSIKYN